VAFVEEQEKMQFRDRQYGAERQYGVRSQFTAPTRARSGGLLGVWHSLTAPSDPGPGATFEERERVRRGRLLSTIALGFLLVILIGLPIGLSDPGTLISILGAFVATIIILFMNRVGWVAVAGTLFVLIAEGQFMFTILSAPGGRLDVVYIPLYSLLAFGLLIAVSVLPPFMVFVVAVVNTAFVIADVNLQPATQAMQAILDSPDRYTIIAQPVGLYLITSIVAYLWVRSTLGALRRADRAEEIASLEHTLADQKRQLDIGIQQILQTHVRAANGDYTARAPLGQDNILWQIASSLNNLLSRLQRSGQAEHQLRRTEEEIRRLAASIDDAQSGRKAIWPAPTGTAADLILERIRGGRRGQSRIQEQHPLSAPSQPVSGFPGAGALSWQEQPPYGQRGSVWPDQMGQAQQPAEQAQNEGWPGQQPAQQNGGWPMPAEAPLEAPAGEQEQDRQDANPWAFPQDER
jgi:hypothetical protein